MLHRLYANETRHTTCACDNSIQLYRAMTASNAVTRRHWLQEQLYNVRSRVCLRSVAVHRPQCSKFDVTK